MESAQDVTQLLQDWRKGNKDALDKLMPVVYDEMRRIAGRFLSRQQPGHTLQTTALVHEAYIRLLDGKEMDWQSRAHFFNVAAKIMRRILINYAVAGSAEKRGGDKVKLSLDEVNGLAEKRDLDILALNDLLNELTELDERQSRIVELKFFAGLSNEEIAEVMEISLATVNREWRAAKAWFQTELA